MNERKALRAAYKERKHHGGVYIIKNTVNGKYALDFAIDLRSAHNRFAFAVATNTVPRPAMRADWQALGPHAFALEVLEEFEQEDGQTEAAYRGDLEALYHLWQEKLGSASAY